MYGYYSKKSSGTQIIDKMLETGQRLWGFDTMQAMARLNHWAGIIRTDFKQRQFAHFQLPVSDIDILQVLTELWFVTSSHAAIRTPV
jgi:hypothetical protein